MWNSSRSMRGSIETYTESCSHKLKLFTSFISFIAYFKTNVHVLAFFMQNVNMIFLYFDNFNFNKKTIEKQ